MIIAATGHRPDKLGGYTVQVRLALGGLATEYLAQMQPDKVISGMALGWDQAIAGAAVALGIPFIAAVPFPRQHKQWPQEARDRYERLLAAAESVHCLMGSEQFLSQRQVNEAMDRRNKWIVDQADRVVALWDGSWGGTFGTVAYARERGVQVDNLWNRWTLPADIRELLG